MKLPLPQEKLAGCFWLPRIIAKARAFNAGQLPAEYQTPFCHPAGADGQFLSFFSLTREPVLSAAALQDKEVEQWFLGLVNVTPERVAEWNQLAVNLGRPGFPMADRLETALKGTYKHLADRGLQTVFEVLAADEESAGDDDPRRSSSVQGIAAR